MSQAIITRGEKPERISRVYKGKIDDVSKEKRTVTSIITTDCIDRYKEVIVAKGIKLDAFRANPIVLWCHMGSMPVGKNLWIKRFTRDGVSGLMAKTLFAKTELADEIFGLYRDGILNGWSIGANPDWGTYSAPTDEETKGRPDWKKARNLIRNCELCEYSAVSIPANPEALGNDLEKLGNAEVVRMIRESKPWSEFLGEDAEPIERAAPKAPELPALPPVLPPLTGRTFEQAIAEAKGAVAQLTSRSAVERAVSESIDRLKGRV